MDRHLIVGTAGHIDHGKSALVHALTGMDPDRLEEEKRRGITIDLGFADMDLGSGRVVSFVDVPGHERFVRHMVAGAMGIDAVLLVVAADQGIQPQTREHLEICRLLGIGRGIVALTKCDLVDAEIREVVALELEELLTDTFLADAPVIAVSARSGEGLDSLRGALAGLFDALAPRAVDGVARLPVDRSFTLRGFGTVVTGTLVSGTLREGEEVEVLPRGERGRIRGLQVHRHKVEVAFAGQRTAVNLQGLDCTQAPRGATVTWPGALRTTRRAWGRLTLLPSAPRTLEQGGPVRFHQGTADGAGRYRVLERSPGGVLHVELVLNKEAVLAPGDRFILRRPAPVDTVGGGVVVDVCPPRGRDAPQAWFDPASLRPEAAVRLRLARAGAAGRESVGLRSELGLAAAGLEQVLAGLEVRGEAVRAGGAWLDAATWNDLRVRVLEALEAAHAREPLRSGISREVLRGSTSRTLSQEAWRDLLSDLERNGKLRLDGERVARVGHEVRLGGVELELAERIEVRFRQAGLDPPPLAEVTVSEGTERAGPVVELLIEQGRLVRIQDGRLFHAGALEDLRAGLREYARQSRTIDVAAFKELAGVTRKNAIPLLEHLDAERVTRRVGNVREILIS